MKKLLCPLLLLSQLPALAMESDSMAEQLKLVRARRAAQFEEISKGRLTDLEKELVLDKPEPLNREIILSNMCCDDIERTKQAIKALQTSYANPEIFAKLLKRFEDRIVIITKEGYKSHYDKSLLCENLGVINCLIEAGKGNQPIALSKFTKESLDNLYDVFMETKELSTKKIPEIIFSGHYYGLHPTLINRACNMLGTTHSSFLDTFEIEVKEENDWRRNYRKHTYSIDLTQFSEMTDFLIPHELYETIGKNVSKWFYEKIKTKWNKQYARDLDMPWKDSEHLIKFHYYKANDKRKWLPIPLETK